MIERAPGSYARGVWVVCATLCAGLMLAGACSKKSAGEGAASGDKAADGACGEKGQPECPLQAFMSKNLQDPLDAKDVAAVGKNVQRVAEFVPDPSWNTGNNSWSSLVQGVATAAESGDADSTREACKNCHRAWRKRYKDEFRKRPLPQ